jgi:hypothetical protein
LTTTEGKDPSSSNAWFAPGLGLVRMASERTFGTKKLRTDYFLIRSEIK